MTDKKFRWRRVLAIVFGVVLLLAACASYQAWRGYQRFVQSPLTTVPAYDRFDVARGEGLRDIVVDWQQHGITPYGPLFWRLAARQLGVQNQLHAGEYGLEPGLKPFDLLRRMARGKVLQHPFTVVDGWTMAQVRKALAAAPELQHRSNDLDDAALMAALGAPALAPEGQFLADTYAYVKGDSDLAVLRRARQAQLRLLAQAWPQRAPNLPLDTPYQALILASIIEKETAQADERSQIAGVFTRRLQLHMRLETDPTVIYGMGARYTGDIHKSDLLQDTPYNTYVHAGLPPTPIAMIGRPALFAALHPAAGAALYFVARGDGHHVFADSLQEHNRNVACYQLKHCHD